MCYSVQTETDMGCQVAFLKLGCFGTQISSNYQLYHRLSNRERGTPDPKGRKGNIVIKVQTLEQGKVQNSTRDTGPLHAAMTSHRKRGRKYFDLEGKVPTLFKYSYL